MDLVRNSSVYLTTAIELMEVVRILLAYNHQLRNCSTFTLILMGRNFYLLRNFWGDFERMGAM